MIILNYELILVRELLLQNKNYIKLSQKLTKSIFFTTKIVVNSSKLTKILLKRRIERIKQNQIKK